MAQIDYFSNTGASITTSSTSKTSPSKKWISDDVTSFDGLVKAKTPKPATFALMDTNQTSATHGKVNLNLDDFYGAEKSPNNNGVTLTKLPPLLYPTANNIKAIQAHASERFQDILKDFNIPYAPEKITFDNSGKMVIPDNYPYKNQLQEAINQTPGLEREMRDLNALSSHYAALQSLEVVHAEISNAKNDWEVGEILKKYKGVIEKASQGFNMALKFTPNGELSITADGQGLKL